MDLMTEEQLERYEAFRRSNLNGKNLKRVSSCSMQVVVVDLQQHFF